MLTLLFKISTDFLQRRKYFVSSSDMLFTSLYNYDHYFLCITSFYASFASNRGIVFPRGKMLNQRPENLYHYSLEFVKKFYSILTRIDSSRISTNKYELGKNIFSFRLIWLFIINLLNAWYMKLTHQNSHFVVKEQYIFLQKTRQIKTRGI